MVEQTKIFVLFENYLTNSILLILRNPEFASFSFFKVIKMWVYQQQNSSVLKKFDQTNSLVRLTKNFVDRIVKKFHK